METNKNKKLMDLVWRAFLNHLRHIPFSTFTNDAGIKAEPSLLSTVIAQDINGSCHTVVSTPYIPSTSHNESFTVWVVNGIAMPFTTASDTHS